MNAGVLSMMETGICWWRNPGDDLKTEMISGWERDNGHKTISRALTHRLRTPTCEGTWQHIQMSEGMRCPHLNFLSKIPPKGKFNQNTSITAISARLAELMGCLMTATSDVAPSIGTLLLSDFQWGTLIWYLLFDNFRRGTFNWYLDFLLAISNVAC